MKTIIHVNQHKIKSNLKNNEKEPPLIARTYKNIRYGNEIQIKDKQGNIVARLLYRPEKPLNCGARAWLETELDVEVK